MTRTTWLFLPLLLLLLLVPQPGAAHYVNLKDALAAPGRLTIGLALAGRPFSWQEEGRTQGFEVAIAEAAAAAHGLELVIRRLPRDGLLAALEAGEVDAVASLALEESLTSMAEARARGLDLLPYLTLGDHLLVLRGNPFRIEGEADLAGRTVAVPSGSSAEVYAHAISEGLEAKGGEAMTIHSFPGQRFVHFPVSMGHAAAFFARSRSAVAIGNDPESRSRLVPGVFRPAGEAGFLLRGGADKLHHALEHALAAMVATGRYERLLEEAGLPPELSAFK